MRRHRARSTAPSADLRSLDRATRRAPAGGRSWRSHRPLRHVPIAVAVAARMPLVFSATDKTRLVSHNIRLCASPRRANGTDRRYSWGSVRLADQRLISSGDRKSTPRRRASPIGARRGRWHCQLSGRLPGPVPDGTLISAEHSGHFQKRMCALPSALRPAFCKIRFLLFSLHTAHNQ
jgi:hypothetical protein